MEGGRTATINNLLRQRLEAKLRKDFGAADAQLAQLGRLVFRTKVKDSDLLQGGSAFRTQGDLHHSIGLFR